MGGTVLTTGYTYDNTTGAVSIPNVTGDVVITAAAEPAYTESTTLYNHLWQSTGKNSDIKARTTYTATLAMNSDVAAVCYKLPDSITVTMGGTKLTAGQYSYNSSTGAVEVYNVSGNIVIAATGAINTGFGFKDTLNITADPNYSDKNRSENGKQATATKSIDQAWRFDDGKGLYTVQNNDYHGITKIPGVIKAYEEGTDWGKIDWNILGWSIKFNFGGNWDRTVTADAGLSAAGSSYVLIYKYGFDSYDFVLVNVKAPEYTVTFKNFNGAQIGEVQTIAYNNPATAPAAPSLTGYTFDGWDKDFRHVTSDLIVTALYTVNSYTLTFMDADHITPLTSIAPITQDYGTAVTAPCRAKRPAIHLPAGSTPPATR